MSLFPGPKSIRKALYKRRQSASAGTGMAVDSMDSAGSLNLPASARTTVGSSAGFAGLAPLPENVTKPISVDVLTRPAQVYSKPTRKPNSPLPGASTVGAATNSKAQSEHPHLRSFSASPHVSSGVSGCAPNGSAVIKQMTSSSNQLNSPSQTVPNQKSSLFVVTPELILAGSKSASNSPALNINYQQPGSSQPVLTENDNGFDYDAPLGPTYRRVSGMGPAGALRRMSMPAPPSIGLPLIRQGEVLSIQERKPSDVTNTEYLAGCDVWELNKIMFESPECVYSIFMKSHRCYDLIPTSSKLVVFDTQLPVRKAFYALVYNGVRATPLWNSELQRFVGMLTITDFIAILVKYYRSGQTGGIKELEEHKIVTWREVMLGAERSKTHLISIDPTESLYKAVQMLCANRIHRLPVLDRASGNIAYILTHKRIIKYLYLYIYDLPTPSFMDKTPRELGLGTWGNIVTVKPDTPLIKVLSKFLDHRISAVPIVGEDGRVIDIYARFDVINLAADQAFNDLDVTVTDALKHRSEWFEGVRSCLDTDSLSTVIETLVKAEIHRMLITDKDKQVQGIVSLSDILKFLVLDNAPSEAVKHKLSDIVNQQNQQMMNAIGASSERINEVVVD